MKNSWNRVVYACWSPFYDLLIGLPFFRTFRRKAIDSMNLQQGQHLLIVGMGTGADLPLLPENITVTGVDLSPAMLRLAKQKADALSIPVEILVADAADLPFEDDTFDAVLLFLILSVVEAPQECLSEVQRVAKRNAIIVVFDKFLSTQAISWTRRLLNMITRFFGTDINRRFSEINGAAKLPIESRKSCGLGKAYELIVLRNH